VTTPYQSASTRLFQDSAEQLALDLEREGSETAAVLAREARDLASRFRAWAEVRPSDDERVATSTGAPLTTSPLEGGPCFTRSGACGRLPGTGRLGSERCTNRTWRSSSRW
jgi:hypothetical protein